MRKTELRKSVPVAEVVPRYVTKSIAHEEVSPDSIDHEHDALCLSLQHILDIAVSERRLLTERSLLENFLRQLIAHHETENTLLKALKPSHWQTHLELHAELISIVKEILSKVSRDSYLDHSAIQGLLVLLTRHVETLDAALLARIGDQHP